ncbi:FMN-binding glutamate synthase family protein [Marinomonas agarivorans]|nr:FMN-binding glutamate synthase family protein [Marinomonas agarivorans]
MEMGNFPEFAFHLLEALSLIFAGLLALLIVAIIYMYIVDINQTEQTIRRNYPVIGRLRYKFEHLGEFFRQYFFAQDREELPFNRAQRSWVYRAAKNVDSTIAFGSTRSLDKPGDLLFLNDPFPTLEEEAKEASHVTIGPYADKPFITNSIYNLSGMSFGALSVPAVTALATGAKKAGIWMNTGEGGLSSYHLQSGCDIVFQIGTAKYGVRDNNSQLCDEKLRGVAAHEQVRMFEIKMSQGAKPGKGGILPGEKVNDEIAAIRGIPVGEDSISPNGHPDIRNIDDLLDMIARIRNVTGKPVGFKAVIGTSAWLEELCEKIHTRGIECAPDFITVDSADGGTGAAPQSLMDYMGTPLKRSLPKVINILISYNLKDRIKVICSGKMVNPSDVAAALCMGADFVVSARGFMFALGCIQALQCNKNTCPTGITTHNPKLQKGLIPSNKAERVANFVKNMRKEVGIIAHSCGVVEPRKLNRSHAELINERGIPMPMSDVYPLPQIKPEYRVESHRSPE